MADALDQTLTELLTPVVTEAGLFLEGVETTRAGRYSNVRVVVDLLDGPGEIDLDTVGQATAAVSAALDAADPVKGQYTLEVTSSGAERRLVTPRHFRRAQGHTVRLVLTGGEEVTGRLTDVTETRLGLELDGASREVALDQVDSAQVVVII